jgi:hypothetical protein
MPAQTEPRRRSQNEIGEWMTRGGPVWLGATDSFYKKPNRIARECQLSRYDPLSRGLDALLRETQGAKLGSELEYQKPRDLTDVSAEARRGTHAEIQYFMNRRCPIASRPKTRAAQLPCRLDDAGVICENDLT